MIKSKIIQERISFCSKSFCHQEIRPGRFPQTHKSKFEIQKPEMI